MDDRRQLTKEELRHTRARLQMVEGVIEATPGSKGRSLVEKIGRNEPCPCGSGVKNKKCCNVLRRRRR